MLTLDEVIAEEMKNPAFKAEWDALEPEFQIIRAIIEGREARNFSEEELSEATGISRRIFSAWRKAPPIPRSVI